MKINKVGFHAKLWSTLVVLVLGTSAMPALAQVCPIPGASGPSATLSGVVNEYFPGSASVSAGATTITVGSSRNGGAIAAGDLLLVMQMQDATLHLANDHAYGDGPAGNGATASGSTSIGQTGLYEYVIATSAVAAGGGAVTVFGEGSGNGLVNAYNAAAATNTRGQRTFQVIKVPQYSTATVTGTLTASAWNGATGGVLVVDVAGDVTFAGGNIDVAGKGFRGGGGRLLTGAAGTSESDVMTSNTVAAHGGKGEGIAGTPRYVSQCYLGFPCLATLDTAGPGYPGGAGTGYDNARGAPGNAGGGGTDGSPTISAENSGGGGGSNWGEGGQGGNGWCDGSVRPCPASPSATGGWGGTSYAASLGATRLFMGGGGGAGVNSDGTGTGGDGRSSSGAPGGGIALLRAGRVQGSGSVFAYGYSGDTTAGIDGSGGGGAGGSAIVYESTAGTGTITFDMGGGRGGNNTPAPPASEHGPGGGGGGGLVLTNIPFPTISTLGGIAGTTSAPGAVNYGATAGADGSAAFIAGAAIVGVDAPGGCLPILSVTKSTSTPTITAASGATANYTVTVTNTGGAAQNVSVIENALPPGWQFSGTPTYTYSPAPPPGAGVLPTGAEATAGGATFPLRASGAAPGTVPAAGAGSLNWGTFFIPKNGTVTIAYTVAVADASAVGTYHAPAGLTFLDPTRSTAGRLVTPSTNAAANRSGAAYSANTTYQSGGGATVAGSNYSGLEAGPNTDDVRLLPDLSVALSHTGNFTPGAAGQSYTLTARNNGRAIRDLAFAADQTSTVALGSVAATLGANPVTATANLPAGLTLSAAATGTNWTCTGAVGASSASCTLANGSAYPILGATNFAPVTVPVAVNVSACPGPANATATVNLAAGETLNASNSATDVTALSCGQAIDVVKSLNTAVTAVSATTFDVPYRVIVKNTAGIDFPAFQAVENLASTFSSGTPTLSWATAPAVTATAPATLAQCALNPAFVAAPTATNVFDGRQALPAGGSCSVTFTVRATYASAAAVPTAAQNNSVVATGYLTVAGAAGGTPTTVLATDTSSNSANPPATANGDTAAATPATLSGVDLTMTNALSGALTVGNNATYTLTPRNSGGTPTTAAITVTNTLPTGLQFVSATGTGWTCSTAGQVVTCTSSTAIPANTNGNPVTLTVAVLASAVPSGTTANVTNTASISGGGELASAAGNNTGSTTNVASIPGAASGVVWRDVNGDRLRQSAEPLLAGWIVEVLSGTTVASTATTNAGGVYSLTGLAPGSYTIRFRDPGNNIIYGTPVNGETANPQPGSSVAADRSGLLITIVAGQTLPQQSLPIDPAGVVYDSESRQPLAGASVQLCGPAGFSPATQLVGGASYTVSGLCASMLTSANGFYQFLLAPGAPAGTYTLATTAPSGYAVSSTIVAQTATLTPPTAAGFYAVQPQSTPPTGSQATTFYTSLALAIGRQDVINNHIPLDPRVRRIIVAEKHASAAEVEIGDSIAYSIDVRSVQGDSLPVLTFTDRLPAGFRYIPGTARVQYQGAPLAVLADPSGGIGPVLGFDLARAGAPVLPAGGRVTISYRVRVGVGAQQGDGTNRVVASGGAVTSNEAKVRVAVSGGVFTNEACIIGKVYLDCDGNRVQSAGEVGVPGVRVYFEDGTYLISDSEGKYSHCGLRPTTHVVKIDSTTVPLGARVGIVDNRNALDADSRFVDLKNGELHRVDFALQTCSSEVNDAVKKRREAGEVNGPAVTRTEATEAGKAVAAAKPAAGSSPGVTPNPAAGTQEVRP